MQEDKKQHMYTMVGAYLVSRLRTFISCIYEVGLTMFNELKLL